jgi:hypothetical protein
MFRIYVQAPDDTRTPLGRPVETREKAESIARSEWAHFETGRYAGPLEAHSKIVIVPETAVTSVVERQARPSHLTAAEETVGELHSDFLGRASTVARLLEGVTEGDRDELSIPTVEQARTAAKDLTDLAASILLLAGAADVVRKGVK